jgi:outer membrane cobalamin receptor
MAAVIAASLVTLASPAYAGVRNAATAALPVYSQPVSATSVIRGAVRDALGVPVADAVVTLVTAQGTFTKTTSKLGQFEFDALSTGSYYLTADKDGYKHSISDTIQILEVATIDVTIPLDKIGERSVLGHVTVTSHGGVQNSPVIYQVVSKANLDKLATFRAFDRLQFLPGLNAGQYNSASPGDNASVNIRGIGYIETVTLIDGHPAAIANSGCGCFEYNVAPTMSLKAVDVTYGSGAVGLYGVNAIGGVVDLQTIDPTVRPQSVYSLGVGSYNDTVWTMTNTGTEGKLGYAVNYGTRTTDGSLFHNRLYNPSANPDPANPALRPSATYPVDMGFQSRSSLLKFRYSFDPNTHFLVSALSADTWDDKTGNGDNDYNPFNTAFANAQTQVGNDIPNCGPNKINIKDPNNGNPRCFTPTQAAKIFNGPQGGGPADQTFRLNDFHTNLSHTHGNSTLSADFYHGFYVRNYNRFFQLPAPNPYWFVEGSQQTGVQVSDDIAAGNNDLGFGYYVQHVQEARTFLAVPAASPYFVDGNIFARDIITGQHLTTYINMWEKRSQLTNTSHLDPRVTLVFHPDAFNSWRLTAGGGITQPNPTDRYASFSGVGAINPNCNGLTNIGKGPGTTLIPETSSDLEASYGHQWQSGSTIQLTAYNTNLYSQLFATNVVVASLGQGYVPAQLLQQIYQRIQNVCPGSNPTLQSLSVGITENLGHSLYKGVELNGSQRLSQALTFGYSYNVQSAQPLVLDHNLYLRSPNLILDSQLPYIPIHKAQISFDYNKNGWDAYIEGFHLDKNNSYLLPAYNFANLALGKTVGRFKYQFTVQNLFNSWADSFGYFGHGFLPVNPLNSQPANQFLDGYEQFHLPYRQYFFNVTTKVGG